jgi:hypothetical protein
MRFLWLHVPTTPNAHTGHVSMCGTIWINSAESKGHQTSWAGWRIFFNHFGWQQNKIIPADRSITIKPIEQFGKRLRLECGKQALSKSALVKVNTQRVVKAPALRPDRPLTASGALGRRRQWALFASLPLHTNAGSNKRTQDTILVRVPSVTPFPLDSHVTWDDGQLCRNHYATAT